MGLREAMGAGDSPKRRENTRITRGPEPLGKDSTGRSGLEKHDPTGPNYGLGQGQLSQRASWAWASTCCHDSRVSKHLG